MILVHDERIRPEKYRRMWTQAGSDAGTSGAGSLPADRGPAERLGLGLIQVHPSPAKDAAPVDDTG